MHTTIVSVDELASHRNNAAWVIVDCRHLLQDFNAGRRMYEAAHIPGAFFAHGEDEDDAGGLGEEKEISGKDEGVNVLAGVWRVGEDCDGDKELENGGLSSSISKTL